MERIQSYDKNGWNYIDQLHKFVDGGMADVSFINTVSEIVTGSIGNQVPFTGQRWATFNMLLDSLHLKEHQSIISTMSNYRYRWSGVETASSYYGFHLMGLLALAFSWMEILS